MTSRLSLSAAPLLAFLAFALVSRSTAREDPTLVKERDSWTTNDKGLDTIGLSPDDKYLFVRVYGEKLKLWDLKAKKEVGSLSGSENFSRKAAFSPDSKTLATLNHEVSVKLWHVPSLKLKGTLGEKRSGLSSLAFSADGKRFAGGGFVKKGNDLVHLIRIWDVESGKEVAVFELHDKWGAESLVFGPDGKSVISGGYGGMIRFWDLKTGKESGSCNVGKESVTALAITKDGKRLASAGRDQISLLDVSACKRVENLLKTHQWASIDCLAFSPDGKVLAVPGADRLLLFDTEVGKIKKWLRGHEKGTDGVAITSDGKTIISTGADGNIKFWDMPD
jgi:WD40 repeat protein